MESRLPSHASSARLRFFWGLQAAPDLSSQIEVWRRESRAVLPSARWPRPEDSHLTLAFLGGRPAQERDSILEAGREAISDLEAFVLRTASLGAFPSMKRARILWLGFVAEPALVKLAARLQRAMESFGAAEQPFRPHLTLARFKEPVPLPALSEIEPTTIRIDAIHLFHSDPQAEGPRYRILGSVSLRT